MSYVAFPEIKPPERSLHNKMSASENQVHDQKLQSTPEVKVNVDKVKSNKAKKIKGTVEDEVIQPVKPTVVHNKDSIILNGKKQSTNYKRISDARVQGCIQWNRNSSRRTTPYSV